MVLNHWLEIRYRRLLQGRVGYQFHMVWRRIALRCENRNGCLPYCPRIGRQCPETFWRNAYFGANRTGTRSHRPDGRGQRLRLRYENDRKRNGVAKHQRPRRLIRRIDGYTLGGGRMNVGECGISNMNYEIVL